MHYNRSVVWYRPLKINRYWKDILWLCRGGYMNRIKRYAVFHNGELFFRFSFNEVLELLTSFDLGINDVQLYSAGGVLIVDCD